MHTIRLGLALAKVDFQLRHEGSYLGVLWYILNPLVMFLILYAVFSRNLGQNIEAYPLYLLIGIIIFNFFRQVTIESTRVIYNNRLIIKSINFPKEALVSSALLRTFYAHIFEIIILALFFIFFDISVFYILWYIPILIFFLVFIFGFSLLLAALSVYFMDLEQLWIAGSQILWFVTPIFYSIVSNEWLTYINIFNPIYYFISIARSVVLYNTQPHLWMIIGAIGYSLTFLVLGLVVFNKLKNRFSEKF